VGRAIRILLGLAAATTFGVFFVAVGVRALYFTDALPAGLEPAVGEALRLELREMRLLLPFALHQLLALVLLAAAFVLRPRWWLAPAVGARRRWRLRRWAWLLAGAAFAIHHYLFDADPWAAKVAWGSLPVFALGLVLSGAAPRASIALVALAAGGVGAAALVAPSPSCSAAALVWAAVLCGCAVAARTRLRAAEAALLAVTALPLATFVVPIGLAGLLPDALRRSATVLDERGYAYDICEEPGRNQMFMTVPLCSADDPRACRSGYVAEYDPRTLARRGEYHFFDDDFYGALRELLCLGDGVQVTMNHARLGKRTYTANVMEFRADEPSRFRRTIFPPEVIDGPGVELPGHRAAWDRLRDAVFYASEWSDTVFRLDRASGTFNLDVGEAFPYKRRDRPGTFGLFTGPTSFDERADSLYFTEWGDGSRIWELDLASLRLRSMRDTHDTGSFGVTVDASRRRLITAGFWGINVLDLDSGRLLLRRRLGPGVRLAQIDDHDDLVYVATTFGGHLWVLDRNTFRTLGRISTGLGGRRAYVSADGRHLLASSQWHTFAIDTSAIVERVRSRR
jgi:hypothetical protein